MITKYKLFGIFNLLINLGLIFIASKIISIPTPIEGETFKFTLEMIPAYLPEVIVIFSLITNFLIAYKLILKKETKNFKLYIFWTLATIIWIPIIFIGYFFASSLTFLLICLTLIAIAFYFIQKISRKSAIAISLLSLIVVIFSIASALEEDYCLEKGDEALAEAGTETVIATEEDEQKLSGALGGTNVKAGQPVYTHFRAHFLCHKDFEYSQALKEKYLFSK